MAVGRSPAAQRAAIEKRAKLRQSQFEADLRVVADRPEGRRLLWAIVERCHLFESSYDESHALTCLREGERSIGLWLFGNWQSAAWRSLQAAVQEANMDQKAERQDQEALRAATAAEFGIDSGGEEAGSEEAG